MNVNNNIEQRRICYKDIQLLLRFNSLLLNRTSILGKATIVLIVMLCIITILISWHFFRTTGAPSLYKELPLAAGLMMYIIIIYDFMISAGRYSAGSILHPGHLFRFPVSSGYLFSYLVLNQIINIKSLVYCSYAASFILGIAMVSILSGLVAFFLYSAFFVVLEIWITVILIMSGRIFSKNKILYPLLIIVLLLPIYLSIMDIIEPMVIVRIFTSPVFGSVGNGIIYTLDGRWENSVIILLIMIAAGVIGVIIGRHIIKKKEFFSYLD